MNKLVSVVVPNYNCADYLDKCLESIVSQTYTNIECIVCDDGSVDNSVEIINRWAAKDQRIKVLINKENQGAVKCYNRMFFEAKGDYIMIQDSDDWCDPQRVEKQAEVLSSMNVGCCMANSVFYYGHSEAEYPPKPGSRIISLADKDWGWAPATIMFKRAVLDKIKGYNKYFDRLTAFDNYFIMSVVNEFGGYYLDEYLYFVVARANSDHRSIDLANPKALNKIIAFDIYNILKQQRIDTGTDLLKDGKMDELYAIEKKLMSDKKHIADRVRIYACIQIDNRNFKAGWSLLKQAINMAPTLMVNYQSVLYLLRAKMRKAA